MHRQAMIVEPTSVNSRSPVHRALRALALATPAVLLVAAVGVGMAGPKAPASPDAFLASPLSSASSPEAPSSSASSRPGAAPIAFPAEFGSMPALRPSEVLAARIAGTAPDAVVVAGYLAIDWVDLACKDAPLGAAGPWCDRRGTIYEAPIATVGNTGSGGRPAHLHVTIPIGVRIPDTIAATEGGAAGSTVPAVVIGRFAPGGSCGGNPQSCDQGFVVDRVTWASGLAYTLAPLVEPRLDPDPRANPFAIAVRLGLLPLEGVLARPSTIATLDARAGAAAAMAPPSEPEWFLRVIAGVGPGVETSTGPGARKADPRVVWLLLDELNLRVIASGPMASPASGRASVQATGG
jgi:hypothetical protein